MKDKIKNIIPYLGVITLILIPVIAVLWIWNVGNMGSGFYWKVLVTDIIVLICLFILDWLIE
jgi:hypothetical protein